MEFRIAQITDDPQGVLTGAFVFSPPPVLPDKPTVLVERFDGENTRLGLHGWAVDSKGLRPRLIEKRGPELWLCFGAEVSFHVLPNTPVRVTIPGSDVEGIEIWPPIPRGKAPPAPPANPDGEWEAPAPPRKPEAAPPPPPPPPPPTNPPAPPGIDEGETIIRTPVVEEPPPPPPPLPPPPPAPPVSTGGKLPLIAGLVVLLLLIGGATAWWFLRDPAAPAPPAPIAQVAPPAPPADPNCAEAADVLSGKCANDRLRALPPAEQTRLAEALLRSGDPRGNTLAPALLTLARTQNHGPASLALARLYSPLRPAGPIPPNPVRALEEYGRAVEAGLPEARTERDALVASLRQQASGTDPAAAQQARDALAAAGLQ